MTRALAIAAVVAVLGCGDDGTARVEVRQVVAATEGRVVVARVDGRPVFASCVQSQAAAHGIDARAALDECIEFELLAQEAERRGYGNDPDAADAQRREAVRALLRTDFETAFGDPAAIPLDDVNEVFGRPRVHLRYNHPEYRFAYFVRAEAENRPPEVWDDAERRIRALHRDLARKRGLTREDLWAAVAAHTTDDYQFFVSKKAVNGPRQGRLEENFTRALFAVPEAGMVSAPVKTRWGWDLILLVRIDPAVRHRVDEVAGEIRQFMFPSWQRTQFLDWTKQLAANARVDVKEDWESTLPPSSELVAP